MKRRDALRLGAFIVAGGFSGTIIGRGFLLAKRLPKRDDSLPQDATKEQILGDNKIAVKGRDTVVCFIDYECRFCAEAFKILDGDEFSRRLNIVYRNLPLPTIHPNAYPAALIAETAHLRGKFTVVQRRIFDTKTTLSPGRIKRLADDFDLYPTEAELNQLRARIQKDGSDASRLRIKGTPTIVYLGERQKPSVVGIQQLRALL